ncbi:MAG: glycosyltransferase family 39 protein [Crocinitomicaceae bacterium]|nr:glycosyltransferase family 39 protein [Crocinitomicaceae bacterium]
MNVEGLIVVILCLIGYWFAWKSFKQGKYRLSILILVLLGVALRVFAGSDMFIHDWDERYHALVAKNMMDDPFTPMLYQNPILDYKIENWTSNHIWLHKQPLSLWAMSASMSIFGVNEIALRLPSILLSGLGIYLLFAVGKMLFNKRIGFIAAFLFSIHGLIIELTAGRVTTDHVDVFFLVFILLAVYFSLKFAQQGKIIFNILAGVAISCAILSKWLPALIVLPIWLVIVKDIGKLNFKQILGHGFLLVLTLFIVAAPWQFYTQYYFPIEAAYEKQFNLKHLTEVIEDQGGPFYYHFDKMRMVYGELVYLPVLWLIYLLVKKWKNTRIRILTIWILVPYLFFSFAATKMQGYTLFTAPALFLLIAFYFHYLKFNLSKFKQKWLVVAVLIALIALPIRFSLERLKPFNKYERNPAWIVAIKKLDLGESDKTVIFNTDHPIEVMFYTDYTAYTQIPSNRILDSLSNQGYKIYFDVGSRRVNDKIDSTKYNFISLPSRP